MKPLIFITAIVLLSFIAVAEEQPTPPAQPLAVAVLDFQTSGEKFGKKGSEVAVLLNAQLSTSPNLLLVERQEIEKLLSEQELGLSGTVTPDTAAKVGALTGAKVLVTGRLFDSGSKFFLVTKIMSTETSRVYGETATFNDLSTMDRAVAELATKVDDVIGKRADTLLAKVEDPSERIGRLRKAIAGKKLPSVSVAIAEQHIGARAIDPAAETEMKLVLQQIGLEVIDPKESRKQADVQITGEAFSELGGRRGSLVSCRSRVEVKVVRVDTGKLLLAERQNDVAVDLAENVAGKRALENAALKLMNRIVPKLVAEQQ